ncbi:hypothetical protein [Streptomyces sp. NPDC096311]|uniref:hypothetical protein n=1 Tax=Streptomyces sp. NPDC096311 TaxID=3366083 RepID=UPI0037F403E0
MPQNLSERPDFFARHRALLEQAVAATASRGHWTPYPESPSTSAYGEDAAKAGEAAFHERLGAPFELPGHPASGPRRAAGPDARAGAAAEILARPNAASFDRARRAAHHRPGLVRAFQAGGRSTRECTCRRTSPAASS